MPINTSGPIMGVAQALLGQQMKKSVETTSSAAYLSMVDAQEKKQLSMSRGDKREVVKKFYEEKRMQDPLYSKRVGDVNKGLQERFAGMVKQSGPEFDKLRGALDKLDGGKK